MSVEPAERGVMLSIRPRHVDAILAQTKTVELRRRKIRASEGTPVLLYSSTPVKAVVGVATVALIDEATPERLWVDLGIFAGLTRDEFDNYFEGAHVGYGLHLTGVQRLPLPIPLATLRELGLEPPQSFRYLNEFQQHQLATTAGFHPTATNHCPTPDRFLPSVIVKNEARLPVRLARLFFRRRRSSNNSPR